MLKRQLEYVLYLRGVVIPKRLGMKDLKEMIGIISPDELNKINSLEALTSSIPGSAYAGYNAKGLLEHLTDETGVEIPINYSSYNDKNGTRAIIALYHDITGLKVPGMRVFTEEQEFLCSFDTGLVVTNAGPGTGKTTVGIERAIRKSNEGVLIISYSNAAINEVYDRFIKKGVKNVGHKNYNCNITVTTLDSVAWRLGDCPKIDKSFSFDNTVEKAMENIKNGQYLKGYKHIIVDECQDIDEKRGTIVKGLYASGMYESMLILGDPRQRITSAGIWYTNMWVQGGYDNPNTQEEDFNRNLSSIPTIGSESEECCDTNVNKIVAKKVGLTISHRFKTTKLVKLHNTISSLRPELHVELKPSCDDLPVGGNIIAFNLKYINEDEGMLDFAKYLNTTYFEKGYNYDDVCVVTPSIHHETNVTAKQSRKLCAVFKDVGIRARLMNKHDDKRKPEENCILFSTINSIKGKEFKVVVLYCMSDYPKFQPQVPYKEADSLIYVANTRAMEQIIYVSHETFDTPRGVPNVNINGLNGIKLEASLKDELKDEYYSVTDVVNSFGWPKLSKVNQHYIDVDSITKYPSAPPFDLGCKRLNGVFIGFVIGILVTGDYPEQFKLLSGKKTTTLNSHDYSKLCKEGYIHNGIITGRITGSTAKKCDVGKLAIIKNGVNAYREGEIERLSLIMSRDITTFTWKDWMLLTQLYDFITGDHMMARYDLEHPRGIFPYSHFKHIADNLVDTFGKGISEKPVKFNLIGGSCDLLFDDVVVELKFTDKIKDEHRNQVMIYSSLLHGRHKPCVYNLKNGNFETLSSKRGPLSWLYMLDAFSVISNHEKVVNDAKNIAISSEQPIMEMPPPNKYISDVTYTSNGKIVDVAIVNLSDPFRSIIQPLQTYDVDVINYIKEHTKIWEKDQVEDLHSNALTTDELHDSFNSLNPHSSSVVYYCLTPMTSIIPSKYGMVSKDISNHPIRSYGIARKDVKIEKRGDDNPSVSTINMNNTFREALNKANKDSKDDKGGYLRPYTPLSNVLMLYQLIHLKLIDL